MKLQALAAALVIAILAGSVAAPTAVAEKKYGPGVSDTEIKIGNTMPYSGPLSNVGTIGRAEAAYFRMLNEHGGVNGRKITFISLDDAYSPPKTVERVIFCTSRARAALNTLWPQSLS